MLFPPPAEFIPLPAEACVRVHPSHPLARAPCLFVVAVLCDVEIAPVEPQTDCGQRITVQGACLHGSIVRGGRGVAHGIRLTDMWAGIPTQRSCRGLAGDSCGNRTAKPRCSFRHKAKFYLRQGPQRGGWVGVCCDVERSGSSGGGSGKGYAGRVVAKQERGDGFSPDVFEVVACA